MGDDVVLPDEAERGVALTVSELTRRIRTVLEGEIPWCWVGGEISNLREPSSGHLYFVLKDTAATIRAVCFRGSRVGLRFTPTDGLDVICFGRVSVYEPRGEYQLIVERMEPRGVGALRRLFEALKRKLAQEGLFDEGRKRPLPLCPQRIVVVTSITGAAVRDLLTILRRAPLPLDISIIPVRVQGYRASGDIARAIRWANEEGASWDLMVIGRGGGSVEDLWAFNEEEVVRAVAVSRIPVISAVGHEIDVTLCDLVADYRAPTPTAAAEWIVDQQGETVRRLDLAREGLMRQVERVLMRAQQRLDLARERLRAPERVFHDRIVRLEEMEGRLSRAVVRALDSKEKHLAILFARILASRQGERLEQLRRQLDTLRDRMVRSIARRMDDVERRLGMVTTILSSLSPYSVVRRGYAIVMRGRDGRIVRHPRDVEIGDSIVVELASGRLICVVKELEGR